MRLQVFFCLCSVTSSLCIYKIHKVARTNVFVKIYAFQKVGAERSKNNVQYVKNNVFYNLKPHKRIALHQIMFFSASSYDPFKILNIVFLNLKRSPSNPTQHKQFVYFKAFLLTSLMFFSSPEQTIRLRRSWGWACFSLWTSVLLPTWIPVAIIRDSKIQWQKTH